MPVVSAKVVFDFRGEPDTSNWTHPDITIKGGPLKVENGVLKKAEGSGRAILFYSGTYGAVVKSFVEQEAKSSFDWSTPGVFNDAGEGFVVKPTGGNARILKLGPDFQETALDHLDLNTQGYLGTDIIGLEYSDTDNTLKSSLNSNPLITRNADTYSGLLRPGVFFVFESSNTSGVKSFGFDGVDVIGLGLIGDGNTFRQGQKGVRVKINGAASSTVSAFAIDGVSTAFATDGAEHIKFDSPFDLAPAAVAISATIDGIDYTKDNNPVLYVQTHPHLAVPAGTTVDSKSIASEMDNPGGRYLKFNIPSQLQFIAPYTALNEAGQSANIYNVLEAKPGTPEQTVHVITGSALDQDGLETPFEIEVLSRSVDRMPAPISFVALTNRATDTSFTSNTVTITDVDEQVTFAVTIGGDPATVIINGVDGLSTATKGDTIALRMRSSPDFESLREAILLLDGVEYARFSVGTMVDPGDIVAPSLIQPLKVSAVYSAGGIINFSLSEDASYRAVLIPSGDPDPTPAEVWAGTASGGAAPAFDSGPESVKGGILETLRFSGLTAETGYRMCLVAEDLVGNRSSCFSLTFTSGVFRPVEKQTKIRMRVLAPGKQANKFNDHDGRVPPELYSKASSEEVSIAVDWDDLLLSDQAVDSYQLINDDNAGLIIIDTAVSADPKSTFVKLIGGYPGERATIITRITSGVEVFERDFVITMRDF